jgi:hypothetical protein
MSVPLDRIMTTQANRFDSNLEFPKSQDSISRSRYHVLVADGRRTARPPRARHAAPPGLPSDTGWLARRCMGSCVIFAGSPSTVLSVVENADNPLAARVHVDVANLHHLATAMTVVIEGANQISLQGWAWCSIRPAS